MRLILTVEADLKPCAAAIDRERPERGRLDFAVIERGSDLVIVSPTKASVVLSIRTKNNRGMSAISLCLVQSARRELIGALSWCRVSHWGAPMKLW
jgi:hypothetical protein